MVVSVYLKLCYFLFVSDVEVSHTYGPLDGSLYATVRGKKGDFVSGGGSVSGGGVSGGAGAVISSVHTVSMDSGISSAGNGLLNQPAATALDHHRALDELLTDMLLTVENIPDLPSVDSRPPRAADLDIPYHARQDSRPFTYGSVPSGDMLRSQSGLSSPSLVRKASTNGTTSNNTTPQHREVRRSNSNHSVPTPPPTTRSPDFHEG